jgi:prepilin-type N-terminal cleavage/methylation domain-containing protein
MRATTRHCDLNFTGGFTLFEFLIVVAILSVVGGAGLVYGMDAFRAGAFRSDRATLHALLWRARSQAMNCVCLGSGCADARPHGVYINSALGTYTLFQGESYATRDAEVDYVVAASPVVTRSGISEVVFAARTAIPNVLGDIVLSGGGRVSTTTIGQEGRIRWTH